MIRGILVLAPAIVACGSGPDNEPLAGLRDLRDRMCRCADRPCSELVAAELDRWRTRWKSSEIDGAADLELEVDACRGRASAIGAPLPSPHTGSATATLGIAGIPAECDDYRAAIERLPTCAKVPQVERDQMRRAYENTSATWASLPIDGKLALATACREAAAITRKRCEP